MSNLKLRKRSSVVCINDEKILVVEMTHPSDLHKTHFFLPGGKIEPGESPWQTAVRETLEETGYTVTIDKQSQRVAQYLFAWGAVNYICQTHFFRATLCETNALNASERKCEEILNSFWLPLPEVKEKLGQHPVILECIEKVMDYRKSL